MEKRGGGGVRVLSAELSAECQVLGVVLAGNEVITCNVGTEAQLNAKEGSAKYNEEDQEAED